MADERDFVHKMSAYEVSFPCVKSRYRPATLKTRQKRTILSVYSGGLSGDSAGSINSLCRI